MQIRVCGTQQRRSRNRILEHRANHLISSKGAIQPIEGVHENTSGNSYSPLPITTAPVLDPTGSPACKVNR